MTTSPERRPAYAAVDWGTSSFRLWLIDADGGVVGERRSGEGMTTAAKTGFSGILESHLAALSAPRDLPVIICGMAGARQGWVEAGYVDVPAPLPAVLTAAAVVRDAQRDIRILPGIAQRGAAPDVMRGEETQLLGARDPSVSGEQLFCMPGTHSKWVRLSGETVSGFASFMTGELFDVISKHTILSHALAEAGAFDGSHPAFLAAVGAVFEEPARATNLVFTVRSGQLLDGLDATGAAARLSGTLIGAEIAGGMADGWQRRKLDAPIRLIVSGRLSDLYQAAFDTLNLPYNTVDADDAVRRGLSQAARAVFAGTH
ncbi:2-dehydro-3-deoxygalactonokinase [Neorhizobium sp. NPDC001467]|uniref:2-dehydro-3-deoxygalactonokinase n=1 Tax=Neorhizobium sp. NPDC001467 TaxID=3390595 RepID=UPI003CFD9DD6